MAGLAIWKVEKRQVGEHLRWMVTRNGEDQLEEPMIFKGQAVRTKERLRKDDEAAMRDAIRAGFGTRNGNLQG